MDIRKSSFIVMYKVCQNDSIYGFFAIIQNITFILQMGEKSDLHNLKSVRILYKCTCFDYCIRYSKRLNLIHSER